MGFFITAAGGYYEGDRAAALDQAVPRRPSPLHVWTGKEWFIDPKVAANTPLDAQMVSLETAAPFTHRTLREWFLSIFSAINWVIDRVNERNALIQAELRLLPGHESFTLAAIPKISATDGVKKVQALDAQIAALRDQRVP